MYYNLPDCMYDYRPSVYGEEEPRKHSDTYCERCGEEISVFEYESTGGYCNKCYDEKESEDDEYGD